MISRIWHGWTTPGNADKYEALLKKANSYTYTALQSDAGNIALPLPAVGPRIN
jgi:hypothetical protein